MDHRDLGWVDADVVHDLTFRSRGHRDDVVGSPGRPTHEHLQRDAPCGPHEVGESGVDQVVDRHHVRARRPQRTDVPERMEHVHLVATELPGEPELLVRVAGGAAGRADVAHDHVDSGRVDEIERCRFAVHVHGVAVVPTEADETAEERDGIRLRAANDAWEQVEEVEADVHRASQGKRCRWQRDRRERTQSARVEFRNPPARPVSSPRRGTRRPWHRPSPATSSHLLGSDRAWRAPPPFIGESQPLGDRFLVERVDQHRRSPSHFFRRGTPARDYRSSLRHGIEHRETKALHLARVGEHRRRPVQPGQDRSAARNRGRSHRPFRRDGRRPTRQHPR